MPLRDQLDRDAFARTRANAIRGLLERRDDGGHWTGRLSASALSTATAVTALALIDRDSHRDLIDRGIAWLAATQNDDGGWGDTVLSLSNISTTTLVWAAFSAAGCAGTSSTPHDYQPVMDAAERRLQQWIQGTDAPQAAALAQAIAKRYGKDRTFSVPILTLCALSGRFGDPGHRRTWALIPQLPFELAAFPRRWFARLNLRVVSYALPALIAIGQVRHHHRPTLNPLSRVMRAAARKRTLALLEQIQPTTGGFLEATPLTSFVAMSLAGCGLHDHVVTRKCAAFLVASAQGEGDGRVSWPIDSNLATWVTTLAINALGAGGRLDDHLSAGEQEAIRGWLLDQHYTDVHPYTDAPPGGWAWTDLPGGVPDADDTSGAVLALAKLGLDDDRTRDAVNAAVRWLAGLQNRDGGMPTFCRGWGRLPFDRSSTDITAHAVIAWEAALATIPPQAGWGVVKMYEKLLAYMGKSQRSDGAWVPLWFGNQHRKDETNPTYGTSRVVRALADNGKNPIRDVLTSLKRGVAWLLATQQQDGGWGSGPDTPASIEETALAVEALATAGRLFPETHDAIARGTRWLIEHTQQGTSFPPAPIGFYFAKLWYYEELYPLLFTVAALQRVAKLMDDGETSE